MNPSADAVAVSSIEWDGYDNHLGENHRRSTDGERGIVVTDTPVDVLYEGTNGRYYTDCQVTTNLRTERWKPCIRQRDPDRRLVETSDGGLLLLTPTDDLPAWAEIRVDNRGTRVVDTRRPLPK
ncbi:hypothetical protein C496_14997 [Natronorubrum tibetense GA33]|uniref:Uncharacterized protein n=1 Tax=Natronorubrum tibetense GA33 TaxID=1114856 RepID=L9VPN5_9EURY|nr:hypothetical protein C496_14997 [Natronorubrum tibetense GA33]